MNAQQMIDEALERIMWNLRVAWIAQQFDNPKVAAAFTIKHRREATSL